MKNLPFTISIVFFLLLESCNNSVDKQKSTNTTQKAEPTDNQKVITKNDKKVILFFGNSLTAGYGLDEPDTYAFPAIIQHIVDSLKLPYQVVNAGLSGETTAGGKERIAWILKQKIEVFVLELGGNDGLRGINPQSSQKNLEEIIQKVKIKYPNAKILLTGMEAPPNMGEKYTAEFRKIFKVIASKNKISFLPFILEGVGGQSRLNQSDGIHPTQEGHQILAKNVWKVLKEII